MDILSDGLSHRGSNGWGNGSSDGMDDGSSDDDGHDRRDSQVAHSMLHCLAFPVVCPCVIVINVHHILITCMRVMYPFVHVPQAAEG